MQALGDRLSTKKQLAIAVRAYREKRGLTQLAMAEILGVSEGTIRNAEQARFLNIRTRFKIRQLVGGDDA